MKSVTISATKVAKIHKLAQTTSTLTKVAALMKKAQDEGNLGPDEVKEIAEDTQQILLSVVEMVNEIAEGVPAEEAIEETTEEVIETPEEKKEIPNVVEGKDDDEDKKENKDKIAKLENELNQMKQASIHKELTIKYGKLFPEIVREAREKEFAKSTDSIKVLEARIKEASAILTDRKAVKVAQLTTSGETFFEDDDYTNNDYNLKGKF